MATLNPTTPRLPSSERCTSEELSRLLADTRANPSKTLPTVKELKGRRQFGGARQLLDALAPFHGDEATRVLLQQQRALCTYKDPDLPRRAAFATAARLLDEIQHHPSRAAQAETRALQGAIFKRKWQVFGNVIDLERSLAYYSAALGHNDTGYAEINQAFVLDTLAYVDETQATASAPASRAAALREESRTLRESIVLQLARPNDGHSKTTWWDSATLAEAYFGLERFEDARREIEHALAQSSPSPWELESTARQLAALALYRHPRRSLKEVRDGEEWRVLAALGITHGAIESAFVGKVGLALSGGGFRASFFHIGVLARLAELDVLRHIEVLSCVSGGSIVGAYYYLALKELLETAPGKKRVEKDDLDPSDYVDLVENVAAGFLAGVQKNIRVRIVENVATTLKMIENDDYTRTHRLAELYDEHLFGRIGQKGLRMRDLKIAPLAEPTFDPKYDNWRRHHKVPALVLNAATLNTAHAWQFTASFMGEPPSHIDDDIDCTGRLRRVYYEEARRHGDIPLSHAVAASSGVPGVFAPLELAGLYPDKKVLLVDGGVHDNQGTATLLEQDCTVLLVSDASEQSPSSATPGDGVLPVMLRTTAALQARVRTAQFRDLDARRLAGVLRGLMFVHLKNGLAEPPVSWEGCLDPSPPSQQDLPTSYGMNREVQFALAGLRTDLDSFSELEAYALMLSGYRMTTEAFRVRPDLAVLPQTEKRHRWAFEEVAPIADAKKDDAARALALARLHDGGSTLFKGWRTVVPTWVSISLLAALSVALLGWLIVGDPNVLTLGGRSLAIAGILAILRYLVPGSLDVVLPDAWLKNKLQRHVAAPVLALLAWLYLRYFEPRFLRDGTIASIRRAGAYGPSQVGQGLAAMEDGRLHAEAAEQTRMA